MHQIVNIIGPTVFAIFLGYLFGRMSRSTMASLIDVAMFVATPCLAFYSMFTSEIVIGQAVKAWASILFVMAGTLVVALLVFTILRQKHSGLYLPIVFANLINIPLPIIYLAFGEAGAAQAILMYIPQGILLYSVGLYVASRQGSMRQGLRTMLRTPLIYAALVGLALNLLNIPLPTVMVNSVKFMGQAAVPLMLLILGSTIGRFRLTQLGLTLGAGFMRMGVGFGLGLLVVWLLSLEGVPRAVVIFESAMPAAVVTSVLCAKYKNQEDLVSSVVLATTLASIGVIPALLYYLA
jgi:malate permease and related proteins